MSKSVEELFRDAPAGATHYVEGITNAVWRNHEGIDALYWHNGKWSLVGMRSAKCEDVLGDQLIARTTQSPQPKPWSGPEDGLPPVGTVCEFAGGTECPEDPFDKDLKEGMKATIIAHFKCGDFTLAAFTFDPENPDRGMVQVEQATFGCFRPIRTPEQLAAEERERTRKIGVAQMMEHIHFSLPKELWGECEPACYALYDAGFKREVV